MHCAFVLDETVLGHLGPDRRLAFLWAAVLELDAALRTRGGGLQVLRGDPVSEIPALAHRLGVQAVFAARDYEPAAKRRDALVLEQLLAQGQAAHFVRDQALFDGDELRTQAGKPYSVFTPYRRAWMQKLSDDVFAPVSFGRLAPPKQAHLPQPSAGPLDPVPLTLPTGALGAREKLRLHFLAHVGQVMVSQKLPGTWPTKPPGTQTRAGRKRRLVLGQKLVDDGPMPKPEFFSKLPPLGQRLRRMLVLAWDGFWDDRCSLAASSLSYQTALALVPLVAIALALLKYGGQLEDGSRLLSVVVRQVFPSSLEAQTEVVSRLSTFSSNFTAGGLGSFGIIAALSVGFFLFLSVESIWNHIWESHRERTYVERFLLFYTGITLIPFVVTLSFVQTEKIWGSFARFLPYLSPLLTTVMLTLANRMIPTLRVQWRAALCGGATAAVLLEISKFGLGRYLAWVARSYQSIYGALGVLPLFLLSIYLWWLIVLWGVEVSRAVQRLPWQLDLLKGAQPPDAQLTINGPLALRLLADVARHFKNGEKNLPVDELGKRHGLPESTVRKVLSRLAKPGFVLEHEDGYLLAKSPDAISVEDVLRLFQPIVHLQSDAAPDGLDELLMQLEKQQQELLSNTTLAHLL